MGGDKEIPNFDKLTREEKKALVQALLDSERKIKREGAWDPDHPQEQIGGTEKLLALLGLPAESSPTSLSRFPLVTVGLIALCSLVSLWALGDTALLETLAFYPGAPTRLGGLTLLTCFLVHGGIAHLAGNMYCLFVFGDNVEDDLGPLPYLLLLGVSTLAASVVSGLLNPGEMIPHVGASGGIMGVMVFYLLRFPKARFTYFFWFRFYRVPAAFVLIVYVFLDFIGAFEQLAGLSDVDHLAHLGGGLGGLLFWWLGGLVRRKGSTPSP